ncbi:MAG: hypothetical protein ACHP7J_00555 [Terriglobales bacterium]
MAQRQRHYLFVPLGQICFVILSIAVQAAESAIALFAASDALAIGDVLPAVGADVLIPEFKETFLL